MMVKIFTVFFTLLLPVNLLAQTSLNIRGFSEGYYRAGTGKMVAVIDSANFPLICDTGIIKIMDTRNLYYRKCYCTWEIH